ncbi:MAG: PEP-CTERM sorting domain-containing protein [Opitutaceae bacterium]|nr:PEP-CTERM sorting domain-containing protein [Opitutaceae bacterium]
MKNIRLYLHFPRVLPALAATAVLLAANLAASLPAQAADAGTGTVTVVSTTARPDANIIASYTPSAVNGLDWRANTSASSEAWRDVGQSFTATQNVTFDAVSFFVSSGLNTPANYTNAAITLTIYSFAADFSSASATKLATLQGFTPASVAKSDYLTFDVRNAGLQLQAGIVYGVLLHFDAMADNRHITLSVQNATGQEIAYSGGRHLKVLNDKDTGTPGSLTSSGSALEFYVQGTPLGTPGIPEPATIAALFGIVALASGFRRLRIRNLRT